MGPHDVVINNASTHWPKTVAETDKRRYDKMMNVNVKGAFIVTTACMPCCDWRTTRTSSP